MVRGWLAALMLPWVQGQCTGTTTISTSAEATALADCGTFDGDVDITDVEGDFSLAGLTRVTGDLYAASLNDLTAVTADRLQTVGGRLVLRYADLLATVRLPVLRNIGELSLSDLPSLRNVDAGEDGFTNVSTVTIRRTALETLTWLRPERVASLIVEENLNLTEATVGRLSVVESYLTASENGPRMALALPDLNIASNISVQGCATVSLPSLSRVNRSISFIDNSFHRLDLAKLLDVGSDLMFWNNSALTTVSVPVLANVSGDVVISANPQLDGLTFPKLGIVEGDISVNGSISKIDMPALTDVQGDVVIRSEVPLDCASLDAYNQQHVLKARYICEGGAGDPGPAPGKKDPASRGLSTGAKAGIAIGAIAGAGLLGLAVFLLWRKTRASRASHKFNHTAVAGAGKERYRTPGDLPTGSKGATEYTKPELSAESALGAKPGLHGDSSNGQSGLDGSTAELESNTARFELPGSTPSGRH